MSIDNPKIVDAVGTDKDGNGVSLTISDHLEWGDQNHLVILQDKLNAYLDFIESGQIYEEYPSAVGSKLNVRIYFKYEPDNEALETLSKFREFFEDKGYGFSFATPRI
jgi:hypothetical protein